MKRLISAMLLFFGILFSGCMSDDVVRKFTYYRPVYKTSLEARAEIKSSAPIAISFPGKIYFKDGYVFLNELYKGIHIIDIRNVTQPRTVSFVRIPGCIDMAVRGNILYADMYSDLIALDISNPLDIKKTHIVEGVFPHNAYAYWVDSGKVITDWIRVDTSVRESDFGMMKSAMDSRAIFSSYAGGPAASSSGGGGNGVGGSMARFALNKDRLYTVSHNDLKVFNTSVADKPSFVRKTDIGWGIETIYPFDNYLFIGSMTGMFIYDATDKDNPVQKSKFEHARVCDPVISDGDYAYVTLRSGTTCMGFTNQLDVLDIKNIVSPSLVKSYPMTNPHGLSKDGNILLICEGDDGLRILDASSPGNVTTVSLLKGFVTYDVIALGGIALVTANDGLYLVNYSNPANPVITSSIKITN